MKINTRSKVSKIPKNQSSVGKRDSDSSENNEDEFFLCLKFDRTYLWGYSSVAEQLLRNQIN